jgi:hypothetical protein
MNENIVPAKRYARADDLWIIASYYNSNNYATKPQNFDKFIESIERSELNYLVVECVFGKQPFSLRKSPNILRVRTADVMWQKERLLNIALQNLPRRCKKIAWVDCDVLFENADWAREASARLEHSKVVQPFKEAIRLPKGVGEYDGAGERYFSFGYVLKNNPYIVSEGKFELHGHTGFAWAARRSIFAEHGFYDACIAGSGDHLMAHSFVGDWSTQCAGRIFGNNQHFRRHYVDWSERIYPSIRSELSYVDGALLHLWHGEVENRKYAIREKTLEKHLFNPAADLRLNEIGCWEWDHNNQELKEWAKEYFVLRREDH